MKTIKTIFTAKTIIFLLIVFQTSFAQQTDFNFTVNQPPEIVFTAVASANTICPGNPVTLTGSGGASSYTWSGGVSDGVAFTPATTASYSVTGTDINNCTDSDSITITVQQPFQNEEICLVTVDTLTGMNKIVWAKTPAVGTGNYIIYRQVTGSFYNYVDMIPFSNAPEFVDVGYNSSVTCNRYKISVVDTCGNESAKSPYHQTIHLGVSQGVPASNIELNWDPYIDENDPLFPDDYYIFRGSSPSNMTIHDTVPGTVTSYTDQNVFSPYYYSIRIQKTCDVFMVAGSNVVFNNVVGSSLINYCGSISISPNPMIASATLEIPNLKSEIRNSKSEKADSDFVLRISDLTGKVVRIILIDELLNHQINSSSNLQIKIERNDLKPGIYFVELKADKVYRGIFVVE